MSIIHPASTSAIGLSVVWHRSECLKKNHFENRPQRAKGTKIMEGHSVEGSSGSADALPPIPQSCTIRDPLGSNDNHGDPAASLPPPVPIVPMEERRGSAADAVATFRDVTGCDNTTAEYMLAACDGDLSAALALYMDQNDVSEGDGAAAYGQKDVTGTSAAGIDSNSSQAIPHMTHTDSRISGDGAGYGVFHDFCATASHEGGAAAGMSAQGEGETGMESMTKAMGMMMANPYGYQPMQDHQGAARRAETQRDMSEGAEYEAMHGVRRPDQIRRQRLVDDQPRGMLGRMNMAGMPFGGETGGSPGASMLDDPSVDWLFPPPKHLSYSGSFDEAKRIAKEHKKWLVVNIQSHTEFTSHMLNRDTWCNDTVESLVQSSFLFWQRGHTSADAKEYMSLYALDETADLPHVAILDTRTGASIVTMKGYVGADQMIAALVEFLDENRFDDYSAPRQRVITGKSGAAVSAQDESDSGYDYSDEEEEQIQGDEKSVDEAAPGSSSLVSLTDMCSKAPDVSAFAGISEVLPSKADHALPTCKKASTVARGEITVDSDCAGSVAGPKGEGESDTEVLTDGRAIDYGAAPEEPAASDPSPTTRVQIKLATGRAVVRRYRVTDTVRGLFAVTRGAIAQPDIRGGFELSTAFPKRELSECLDMTLEEAGLKGTQVVMRWL